MMADEEIDETVVIGDHEVHDQTDDEVADDDEVDEVDEVGSFML